MTPVLFLPQDKQILVPEGTTIILQVPLNFRPYFSLSSFCPIEETVKDGHRIYLHNTPVNAIRPFCTGIYPPDRMPALYYLILNS